MNIYMKILEHKDKTLDLIGTYFSPLHHENKEKKFRQKNLNMKRIIFWNKLTTNIFFILVEHVEETEINIFT